MDKNDLKEKILVLGVTAAIFLPLRLFVSQYISDHWLGNLGVASAISISIIILVKKNRLGWFGTAFQNQISKVIWGKPAKFIIIALVFYMMYFGTTILLIDRGNTVYLHDKEFISSYIAGGSLDKKLLLSLTGPAHRIHGMEQIQFLDYLFSVSYAMLNDAMGGWLVNLHLILFTEQIEVLGLIWFFRKMFKPIQKVAH